MSEPLSSRVTAPAVVDLPSHPDVATWRTAGPDDVDAVHAVLLDAGRIDHPTYIEPREDVVDSFEVGHIDPSSDILLGLAADGDPVATASAVFHPSRNETAKVHLSGAVRPAYRRRGIGSAILAWSYARALQHLATVQRDVPGEVVVYAAEHTPDAAAIAERLGLRTARWFSTMERDLSRDIVVPDVPAGLRTGPFSLDLSEGVREARNDAFRDHWGSLPSVSETWMQFVGGPFLRPDLSTLAFDGSRVVALCMGSVHEEDFAALGASHVYIDLVGVVRDHRGRGLAPAVIARTLAAARAAGLERAVLDVDTASPTGALGLYERLGFVSTQRDRALTRRF